MEKRETLTTKCQAINKLTISSLKCPQPEVLSYSKVFHYHLHKDGSWSHWYMDENWNVINLNVKNERSRIFQHVLVHYV